MKKKTAVRFTRTAVLFKECCRNLRERIFYYGMNLYNKERIPFWNVIVQFNGIGLQQKCYKTKAFHFGMCLKNSNPVFLFIIAYKGRAFHFGI